jgi:uncharacterized protein YbjT (DUF2867 family)
MFAITGAFGQTGLALSQSLLDAGESIRMIVRRDDAQAALWRKKGAEVVIADLTNAEQVIAALANVNGAYLMNPPAYFVPDLFEQARAVHRNLIAAATAAEVPHVVALSSVGAQHAHGTGNILTTHDFEQQLGAYQGKVTILRAANFVENWAWSMQPVMQKSILPSMFKPLERALPMVSALDIGRTAAALMVELPATRRTVELHGPKDYSPADAADIFSRLLDRHIKAVEDNNDGFSATMASMGFPATTVRAFVEMFEGFNSGLVAFEGVHETRNGIVSLQGALETILKSSPTH